MSIKMMLVLDPCESPCVKSRLCSLKA